MIYLKTEGHEVEGVDCGEDLDQMLISKSFDILVLDLNLPMEDGNSIAQRVRYAFPHIGIIMHTVRTTISAKIDGYDCGADFYISKPANLKEINAAIKSLGRRLNRQSLAAFKLDVAGCKLLSPNGDSVNLSISEVFTLQRFALAPGRLLESERLLDDPSSELDSRSKENLEVYFSRLRKKISPIAGNTPSIKAVRGRGYKLCFPIEIIQI
jgi:DNA-binding response OmpR family regulator